MSSTDKFPELLPLNVSVELTQTQVDQINKTLSKLLNKLPVKEIYPLVGKPLKDIIRFYVEQTIVVNNGNKAKAARVLGIGERTLFRWLKNPNIKSASLGLLGEKHLSEAGVGT